MSNVFSNFLHLKREESLGQITPEQERLAKYLLGRLPPGESDAIRERLFQEDDLLSEMEAVERDLLDAYAAGRLSAADQRAVCARLITSDVARDKLRFAFALHSPAGAPKPLPWVWWAAAAGLLLCLGGVGAWVGRLTSENRELRVQLARMREVSARPPVPQQAVPELAFLITPVDRGSDEPVLQIGGAVSLIRLNLAIGESSGDAADVRVRTARGALVMEEHGVPIEGAPGATYLSIWLPRAALPPGSYSIAVVGKANEETTFAFRVNAAK
jgi:hypothetical protein